MEISLDEQNKILDQVRQKAKEDETVREIFDEYELDLDEIDYLPMCFADLDVSARTMHGIIYFNLKLLEDPDPIEKIMEYYTHEITHTAQQTTGDGPTEGSSDDSDYLSNKFEQEGFQNQTKYISRNESPEKAEAYVEKVLEHHSVPESEKEEKKEDLLRTSSELKRFAIGESDFLFRKKDENKRCQNCGYYFQFGEWPNKTHKIRGKIICDKCYDQLIAYRKTIPCTCGHLHNEHSLKEGERHTGKHHCNAIIIPDDYRSSPKKCPCENYKPSQDDYSDASDGKQLSLEFEKSNKSIPRTENIQELKDRIMYEIETGEEFKRKEKYRERPSLNLIRKEHPYARKNIADLARKVMEATEKKDDNSLDDSDRCSCGHLKTDHAPKIGLCFVCEYCNGYSNENESEYKIDNIIDQECNSCGHLRHQHLNDRNCQEFIGGSYRSRPQQCSCECYV